MPAHCPFQEPGKTIPAPVHPINHSATTKPALRMGSLTAPSTKPVAVSRTPSKSFNGSIAALVAESVEDARSAGTAVGVEAAAVAAAVSQS